MKIVNAGIMTLFLSLPWMAYAAEIPDGCKAVEFMDHVEIVCGDEAATNPSPAEATPQSAPAAASADPSATPDSPADAAATAGAEPAKEEINPQPVVVPAEPGQGIGGNYSRRAQRHEQAQRVNEQRPDGSAPQTPPAATSQPQDVPGN
jgi:hypothetical protein